MKTLANARVPAALLALAMIVAAAGWLVWKVAILDAPPRGEVVIIPAQTNQASTPSLTPEAEAVTPSGTQFLSGLTAVAGVATVPSPTRAGTAASVATPASEATPSPQLVVIYVSGAVENQGLYSLTLGSRVGDAIALAGGLSPEADPNGLNLAALLSDEEHIIVPRRGDTPVAKPTHSAAARASATPRSGSRPETVGSSGSPTASTSRSDSKVNLNTAGEAELEALPGIGPVLAARIVSFREANGPFAVPEDLMKVPGIKEALFGKVRDYITVGP